MNADELAYYRAVEDHFAFLRGTPFLFSPRDFALLRRWWAEGVPLAAVLVGLTEVFERRRERGDDPVSSLSYCRHAVARHARRLGAARVGTAEPETPIDVPARLAALAAAVRGAGRLFAGEEALGRALSRLAAAIETLPPAAPPAALDEELAQLEASALDALVEALPGALAAQVTGEVERQLGELGLDEEARGRTRVALRRRAVREALGLPRLEL